MTNAPAQSVQGVEAVAVKPLEWEATGAHWAAPQWRAADLYIIEDGGDCFWLHWPNSGPSVQFDNEDAAKAAAQADYEARIRSALLPREAPAAVAEVKRFSAGQIAYAKVRVDSDTEDGWAFATPTNHPDDIRKGLAVGELDESQQIYGEIYASPAPAPEAPAGKFKRGDRVSKIKGSAWTGRVVGTYSTALTPEGYAVESETETGSVQIYPAAALALATQADDTKGGA